MNIILGTNLDTKTRMNLEILREINQKYKNEITQVIFYRIRYKTDQNSCHLIKNKEFGQQISR